MSLITELSQSRHHKVVIGVFNRAKLHVKYLRPNKFPLTADIFYVIDNRIVTKFWWNQPLSQVAVGDDLKALAIIMAVQVLELIGPPDSWREPDQRHLYWFLSPCKVYGIHINDINTACWT